MNNAHWIKVNGELIKLTELLLQHQHVSIQSGIMSYRNTNVCI